ncbi:DUF4304 domain-containing protein [Quadrisphaera sp. INWT6]|uniref:DUF4304 domain-containing protein n=1 Tax=Quadrisphaera sp. INWT6 TaxID=2596917 RepID=UPI001891FFC9|nr:DUF4304 domain-containing protein [Quadrisphaera sp. INWT6]MBF5080789.1 hypothetical protein [Quadrisphaera sp. INWT6]
MHADGVGTPEADAMREVVAHVHPALTAAGFRKRRHTFNRTVQPGLVHVIKYQLAPADPAGVEEVPGVHMNLQGLFAVQLGVYIAESWQLQHGHHGDRAPVTATGQAVKEWVNDYDCDIREELVSDDPGLKWMFPLDDPQSMAALQVQLLHSEVLPWLQRYSTRQSILEQVEAAPVDSRDICGDAGAGPDRLLAVRMHLGAGNRQVAQRHFEAWVRHCRSELAPGAEDDGHLEFLAEFADSTGLMMPPRGGV